MSDIQKIILIALLALGALSLIVGLTLSHYIGGFIRNVEREAQEEAAAEEARRAAQSDEAPEKSDDAPEESDDAPEESDDAQS